MIKIVLDKETQRAIKSIHWEDAQTAQTGLVKRLEKDEIRDWLREEYTFLYDYFYNSMGKLEKEKVKELLFLNRVEMKKLISKWKALGKKDSEELPFFDKKSRKNGENMHSVLKTIGKTEPIRLANGIDQRQTKSCGTFFLPFLSTSSSSTAKVSH